MVLQQNILPSQEWFSKKDQPLPCPRKLAQRRAHRAQWRVTSVLTQAKPWRRRKSLPPSMSNPPGMERHVVAEPKNKRPPLAVFYFWCERWDLNPHDLTDTSTSSLPVCRFQHARERNLRYYNKIPLFVKRQPEKLPESFASRHPPVRRWPHGVMVLLRNCSPRPHRSVKGKTRQKTGYPVQTMASQRRRA